MEENGPFLNTDELMSQVSIEEVARFYGVPLPTLRKIGTEARTACFLNCGKKTPTDESALAIQTDAPTKNWICHQQGCGKSGDLVSLCDLLKSVQSNLVRLSEERFIEIAHDLLTMAIVGTGPSVPLTSSFPSGPSPNPLLECSSSQSGSTYSEVTPENLRRTVADALNGWGRSFLRYPGFCGIKLAEPTPGQFKATVLFTQKVPAIAEVPRLFSADIPEYGIIKVAVGVEICEPFVLGQ